MTPIRIKDMNKMGTHMAQNGNGGGNGNGNGNGNDNFFGPRPFGGYPIYPTYPYVAPVYEPIPRVGSISPLITAAAIVGGAILLVAVLK